MLMTGDPAGHDPTVAVEKLRVRRPRCRVVVDARPLDLGPGRPGWLPTQVPHRSGLAHDAHPVPHLMNSRPARSVVGTWTWFRSRCTCQVSLQRLMRRHPLPSTGSLGLVPPLPRYYEVLRLPAAHFAALRFLRLAIPSLRPWFVPSDPGVTRQAEWTMSELPGAAPATDNDEGSPRVVISGLNRTAFDLAVYASQGWSPTRHARLASGCWSGSTGRDWLPAGFHLKGFKLRLSSSPELLGAMSVHLFGQE